MKWYSENNVRNHIKGIISSSDLLALGCDAKDVATWDNPSRAANRLLKELLKLPDTSAFCSDFGLVAAEHRKLIEHALFLLANSSEAK